MPVRKPSPASPAPVQGAADSSRHDPWLLLVLQLPTRPVAVRVKIWRRLQRLGALAVKNAVYALPDRTETREDFEWVRAEVAAAGGQATVFQASTIDAAPSDELREAFRRDRQKDYRALVRSVDKVERMAGKARRQDPRAIARASRAWRARLTEIEGSDYFAADGRDEARAAVARLEARAAGPAASTPAADGALDAAAFQGRRWQTRPRPGIDRMASAWLIRRFVDPQAVFVFGEPTAKRAPDVVTFDMFEGDFTHAGDRCTFEVLCARFGLTDRRVRDTAEIVHDLDLKDARYGRVEAPLLGALVEGLRQLHERDDQLLEQGVAVFEALYQGQAVSPASASRKPSGATRRRQSGHQAKGAR